MSHPSGHHSNHHPDRQPEQHDRALTAGFIRRSLTGPDAGPPIWAQARQVHEHLRSNGLGSGSGLDITHTPNTDKARDEIGDQTRATAGEQAGEPAAAKSGGLRFALYGYTHKDPAGPKPHAFQWWQSQTALKAIAPSGGQLVKQYFDVLPPLGGAPGHDLHSQWGQRKQARDLIADLPGDDFDAVIIARITSRTFAPASVWDVVELLALRGKQLWVPETGHALDPTNREDVLLMKIYAAAAEPSQGQRPAPASAYRSFTATRSAPPVNPQR